MPLPNDLEDWLTETGDSVVRKASSGITLSVSERLIYEIWLLDTEARNGGLPQYFCNNDLTRWERCVAAASACGLTSFAPFAKQVNALIMGARDPYQALINHGDLADKIYEAHQNLIVEELRTRSSTVS